MLRSSGLIGCVYKMMRLREIGVPASPIVFQTGRPARARSGPARCSPALCSPKPFSCRAVLGVGPNWRPRHGPMANFSGRAGTTPRTARWAVTRPGTIAGDAHGCGQWQSSAPRGLRRTRMQPVAQVHRPGAPPPAVDGTRGCG
jgi:hypothetical protein